ncbi:MAG: endonuclease/exonuclease/phosphatase family protein [Bacteroidales bacterium]|nr:endonuclease/exonuclease/phosphatase family protein [Bacteroidales bacterium]
MKTLKRTAVFINIVAAVSLIAVFISVKISPEKTLVVALLPFVYIGLMAVNVCFVILWLFIKWKYSFISFAAIVISIKFINLIFPVASLMSDSKEIPDFKIMSYNVMIFGLYNWQENPQIKANILRTINDQNPNILCLQEAYWNTKSHNFITLDSITYLLETDYIYRSAMATAVGGQNFGLATISKYPIINSYSQKFENSFNGFIYTDILLSKDTVRVYNLHLQSIQLDQNDYTVIEEFAEFDDKTKIKTVLKKYLSSLKIRAQQAEIVRASIDSCLYPVFVCGDFNDAPLTYTYFTIVKDLKDSFAKKGRYPGYTWDNFKIKQRIDYIIFDKKYKCVSHDIIKTEDSDHFAIVAGFVSK